jgi:hypothetical protein
MRRLTFALALLGCLLCPVKAAGPIFQHKDKIVQQEFENTYQDIRTKASSSDLDTAEAAIDAVELTLDSVTSGTYTPTLTNTTNIDASTAFVCQYMRVGSVVTVSGNFEVNPTNDNTATTLWISLPIASNFGTVGDCGGVASDDTLTQAGPISADVSNNVAAFNFLATETTNNDFFFTFTYRII